MTYSVNNNINQYQQPLTGIANPQIQGIDQEKLKKEVNNNPVAKVADQKNPLLFAGVFLPAWLLTYMGMNKVAAHSRGEYPESMYGKIDAFQTKITSSKFFDNSLVRGIRKGYNSFKSFVNKSIIDKSAILRASFRNPSSPEHKMVKMMAGGINTELATTAAQLLEKFTEEGKNIEKIKELGFVTEAGAPDVATFTKVTKNPTEYADRILKACKDNAFRAGYEPQHAIKIPLTNKYLTDIFPSTKKIFCNPIYFSEYANKMTAVQKPGLSKGLLRVIEGMTNGGTGAVGGGLFVAGMGAWFITDAIIRSVRAPKGNGDKGKTFAENMLYNLGFYLTMPLGLKIMHGVGGWANIGIDKEYIDKFRVAREELNEKIKSGAIKDKALYQSEVKKVKEILSKAPRRGNWLQRNILQKPFMAIGKILTIGLGNFAPFNPKGITAATSPGVEGFMSRVKQFFTHGKMRGLKWTLGGVRFITFLLVLAPFLAKFFAKGSHLVFGKPTNSILDEGKEKKPEAVIAPAQGGGAPAMNPVAMAPVAKAANNLNNNQMANTPQKRESLIDAHMKNASAPALASAASPVIQSKYIPSDEGVKLFSEVKAPLTEIYKQNRKDAAAEAARGPARFYIPTDEAARIKPGNEKGRFSKDVPTVEEAMNKADKTEKMVDKLIH